MSGELVLAQAARVSERGIALGADVSRAAPVHSLHMLLEVEAASGPIAAVGAGQQGRCRNLRHVFNIMVADPVCLIRIPDPNLFHPGCEFFLSRIRIKEFKYFNPIIDF
jgi:hypothetical protein